VTAGEPLPILDDYLHVCDPGSMSRALFFLSMLLAFSLDASSMAQRLENPWASLTEQTGWVQLGERGIDDRWIVWHFRVYPNQSDWPINPPPPMHARGDQIELRTTSNVNVLDYRLTGERLRFLAPWGSHSQDRTDVVLPSGAIVVVRGLRLGARSADARAVWARVSPVDFDDSRFNGWDRLEHQTGWIRLGEAVRYSNGAIGLLEVSSILSAPRAIPRAGGRVRLTAPAGVYIHDFLTAGEAKRAEVPNNVLRSADSEEVTGVLLPQGSVVEVQQVKHGRSFIGGDISIWARVTPAR